MNLKEEFWKRLYSHWNEPQTAREAGYTIIVPVPGDLAIFLKIALDVCAKQDPLHLCEILIVPDQLSKSFSEQFANWTKDYARPVRLVNLNLLERWKNRVRPRAVYHNWLQLIRGAEAVRTTHALLHDVDLFITLPRFMRTQYEACIERGLACYGVSGIADPWYAQRRLMHLTATWELMFRLDWLMQFPPWQHLAHENRWNGEKHRFDITLFPQCQTPPPLIARTQSESGFIHFQHVIATFRYFQRDQPPYEDEFFRLLFIRLLTDAYDVSDANDALPPLREFIRGTRDRTAPVTFLRPETRVHYPKFRSKLEQLLTSGCLAPEQAAALEAGAYAFDQAFTE